MPILQEPAPPQKPTLSPARGRGQGEGVGSGSITENLPLIPTLLPLAGEKGLCSCIIDMQLHALVALPLVEAQMAGEMAGAAF
jgi:hypothetical protein